MHEKTLIKTVALPDGQEWAWFADANIVGLAPHLDEAGRERALNEAQDFWRRSCLRVVGADDTASRGATVLPNVTIRAVIEAL